MTRFPFSPSYQYISWVVLPDSIRRMDEDAMARHTADQLSKDISVAWDEIIQTSPTFFERTARRYELAQQIYSVTHENATRFVAFNPATRKYSVVSADHPQAIKQYYVTRATWEGWVTIPESER